MREKSPLRLGYLVSRYPAISHTFILREISELRARGWEIHTASINSPDRHANELTAVERTEAEQTFYVKRAAWTGAARSQLSLAMRNPARYVRTLWFAVRLARADVRKVVLCSMYFIEAAMIAKWMRERALAHLHVHFATPAATVAMILTRMAPVTISLTVHGPDEFYDVPGYFLSEKIRSARFICAIGSYARSQLMKIAPVSEWGKFEVAPLGVDPKIFVPRAARDQAGPFEVLCVGRLVPAKGQHVLLAAIARLAAGGRKVLLRLVGDGPERKSLEREARRLAIADAVCFEGALNQEQLQRCWTRADAFALASFAEGIPVVLMEAMAMEIPCVATWITGVPELIRNELDGLLVAPADTEGMAAAIARLMDDPQLRERLGKAGRVRVEERYQLNRNVGHLAEIFERRLRSVA